MKLLTDMTAGASGYTNMCNIIGAGRGCGTPVQIVADSLVSDEPTDNARVLIMRDFDGSLRAVGPASDLYPTANKNHLEVVDATFTADGMGVIR